VDESAFVGLVLDAVQSACSFGGDSRRTTTHLPAGQPRVLLTILAYSYAVGLYASEEIENRITTDSGLRYLSAGARPSWHDLRRFRRQNRKMLQGALSQVLQLARQFRLWSIAKRLPIDVESCGQIAGGYGPEAMEILLADSAANDRIHQAVLRDSMALDD
jgi:hypothetical protein